MATQIRPLYAVNGLVLDAAARAAKSALAAAQHHAAHPADQHALELAYQAFKDAEVVYDMTYFAWAAERGHPIGPDDDSP